MRRHLYERGALVLAGIAIAIAPAGARKKEPLPPATVGLVDNVNGIAAGRDGAIEHFTGLLIDDRGRVERRLGAGEARPERLAWRLDAQGKTLIPSFVDPHAGLIATGLAMMTIDLSDTRTLAEAQARIAATARDNPGKKWILGRGWDAARWGMPERMPTVADLDAAVTGTPAWLLSADGRSGWANSAALRAAGFAGAKLPTGVLSGQAKAQMENVVPAPAPKDRDIAFDKAQQHCLAQGYSAVADMGTSILDWQAYRRAGDRGALRLRIVGYAAGIENMVTVAGSAPSPWLYDDRLRLVGVVLPVDRAGDGARMRNQMSRAAMDGFQVALQLGTVADATEAQAAIAEVRETYGGDRRWRVEDPVGPEEPPFVRLAQLAGSAGGTAGALAAMTGGAAKDMFAEDRFGGLAPGQHADFLIVDRDIGSATPSEIAATHILEHWIDGKRVWKASGG